MNLYLNKFAYKNAATGMHVLYLIFLTERLFLSLIEDLWAALSEVSGMPIAAVMSTWTQQQGYPVLTVDSKQVWTIEHLVELSTSSLYAGEQQAAHYHLPTEIFQR